jgi:hypothetical protein
MHLLQHGFRDYAEPTNPKQVMVKQREKAISVENALEGRLGGAAGNHIGPAPVTHRILQKCSRDCNPLLLTPGHGH